MKVKVIVPSFCDHSRLDDSGQIELPESSRIIDLYKAVKVPLIYYPLFITAVNYDRVSLMHRLKEGDTVSVFWPIGGG